MAKVVKYVCDRCNKELRIDQRIHFEASVRQNHKLIPLKKFDLCKECAGELVGSAIGFDKIKEIDNFVPENDLIG